MYMEREKQRIRKLAGFNALVPGNRLPIIKVSPHDWSTEQAIRSVLQTIGSRVLVLCHGHTYAKRPYLPNNVIYLDLNPVARPDVIGDIRHTGFMARFPENYFDEVYLTYMPPPGPFHKRNLNIYYGVHRLLKPGGRLKSLYIYQMLARNPLVTKEMIGKQIKESTKEIFRDAVVSGVTVIFVK
jgi:hypothetical protein